MYNSHNTWLKCYISNFLEMPFSLFETLKIEERPEEIEIIIVKTQNSKEWVPNSELLEALHQKSKKKINIMAI